jgi:hypothetical protein
MEDLKKQYFQALGFSEDASKREKALNRAYELRTFEIEHYWKRATYFWGFQIAIFAAFGLIWKESNKELNTEWSLITLALTALGVLTALANYLSSIGSSFWQKNWENHIDMLEDKVEGNLYKVVWLDNGERGFSVTRINRCLSVFFIIFWALTTFVVTDKITRGAIGAVFQSITSLQ